MPSTATPTVITTGTLAGGHRANQDHLVVTDHAVAVLDGASSWPPQDPNRDGGWYARTLGTILTTLLVEDSRSLTELIGEAVAQMRDQYRLSAGSCPTSTVTIARWSPETIDIYVLGDSPAVVYPVQGAPQLTYDDRLDLVAAAQQEAYQQHLLSGGGYDSTLVDLLADLQSAQRNRRNRHGGYWIAESNPAAADHGLTARYPTGTVAAVLILSDGASAAVTDYHLHDWCSAAQTISSSGPGTFLEAIHALEEEDPDGSRWPRAKRHDDKTIALIQFPPGIPSSISSAA
jgi:hypothetical protein